MTSSGYELFAELSRALWWFVALSVAYGFIIMTLLGFLKSVWLRRVFNRRAFERQFPDAGFRKELADLTVGGHENALFDLPIAILVEQFHVAATAMSALPSGAGESRARLLESMQRGLNGFHIATANKWKRLLQGWAVILGLVMGCAPFAVWGDKLDFRITAVALAAAVFGGFLAPVFHDALSPLRRRY